MVVEEKNLTVQIATLRRVLDDGRTDRIMSGTLAYRLPGFRTVTMADGRASVGGAGAFAAEARAGR